MSAFGGAACDLHLPPTGCRKLPSFPELPRLPGKPPRWYRTWPQVLLPQPSRWVFSPRYCKPPFSARASLWEASPASPLSRQTVPVSGPSPPLLLTLRKLGAALPAHPRGRLAERSGQITKGLDPVPRRECQGRGDLASHLFFLGTKHAFKSRSRSTGKGWELLGAGQLPQF